MKQIQIDCANTTAVRVDKPVFNADKDVFLIASYVVPKHGPLYDSMDLKDGIVILEEKILQVICDKDVHILLCRGFNAQTGCEQPKLNDMSNYTPGSEEDIIRGDWLIDCEKTLW